MLRGHDIVSIVVMTKSSRPQLKGRLFADLGTLRGQQLWLWHARGLVPGLLLRAPQAQETYWHCGVRRAKGHTHVPAQHFVYSCDFDVNVR